MAKQLHYFFHSISTILKGFGQIMLQNNLWTGLLFIIGISLGSFTMGLAALIAVITGTLTAIILKYDQTSIADGIYGFSAGLVGVALLCFFQSSALIWMMVILGAALASIIQHIFISKHVPAFTFPFILVTWGVLAAIHYFPNSIVLQTGNTETDVHDYVALLARGFGQVIFQTNILSGILFMIGILIHRPLAALFSFISIALSGILAYSLKVPSADIYLGLLSYNAVLCAITFSGKQMEDIILASIAVVLSVLITLQMRLMNLPVLTFPFVLATWITLIIKNNLYSKKLKMGN